MQLKTLGESLSAVKTIQSVSSNTSIALSDRNVILAQSLSKYSIETIKSAASQKKLTKEQVEAILTAKGYQGELLKTTTDEIANISSTNAMSVSQAGATTTTMRLGSAFKGLGVSIANATKSMWTFLTTTPVGWAMLAASIIAGLVGLFDLLTVSLEEQKKKLEEAEKAFSDSTSELKNLNTEIETTTARIKELEALQNPSFVEQGELDKLREVTKELERQKELKQKAQLDAAEDLYEENKLTFEKELGSSYGGISTSELVERLQSGEASFASLDLDNNVADMMSEISYLKEEQSKLTDENAIAEYDNYIKEISASFEKYVTENGQSSLEAISKYKQNIYDIAGVRELSEEEQAYLDYLSEIQKAIYAIYDPAAWNTIEFNSILNTKDIELTKEELIELSKAGKLDKETLKSYPKLYEAIQNSEIICREGETAFEAFAGEIASCEDEIDGFKGGVESTLPSLEELNKQLDSIQSAYKTVESAIEEYNKQGYLSVDTYQSLMELEPKYLHMLMDESGNLNLNTDAVNENTKAYIQNLGIKAAYNMLDKLSAYSTEAEQLDFLTGALNANTDATWGNVYAHLWQLRTTGKITDRVYREAHKKIQAYQQMTNAAMAGVGKGDGSSDDFTKTLDAELKYLDKKMEEGSIHFKDYIANRLALIEDYYDKGKISSDKYYEYLEQHYETELDYMDKIASAVEHRIDREIESVQREIDGLEAKNEALEDTLGKYDSVLNVVEQVYSEEIKRLEDEKSLIQKKIDAINEEADANKKAKAIEEARFILQQKQSQRDKKVYVGSDKGVIYTTDHSAIRDAQDELQQLETEQLIDELEKEQDSIDEIVSSLEEYKDKWAEIPNAHKNALDVLAAQELLGADYQKLILSNRIKDIDAFKEQYISTQKEIDDNTSLIESLEQKIEVYDGLKEQWASLTETYGIEQEEFLLKERFGADYEKVIFDERASALQEFNDDYYNLQKEQVRIAQESARKIIEAEKQKKKRADGDASGFEPLPPVTYKPSSTTTAYEEAQDEKFKLKKYHNGLGGGYAGVSTTLVNERLRMLQKLGYGELKQDEIPALLRVGELVMTPEQQENIFKNMQAIHTFNYAQNVVPMASMKQNTTPVVQNINVTLPNITNNSGYERLQKEFKQMQIDALQIANKR